MKKLALLSAALMILAACGPNLSGTGLGANLPGSGQGSDVSPGAGGNVSVDSFLSSKQAYITFLNCIKTKATTAEDKADVDKAIASINLIPDSSWAVVSASYSAGAQVWAQAYGAACVG